MKKFLSVLLAMMMLALAMAGCGQVPGEEASTTTTPENNVPEETSMDINEEIAVETTVEAEETTTVAEETTTTVTEEATTVPEEETTDPGSAPVLYQIAPDQNMLLNSYLIKTRHGKYIMIDGGGAGSEASSGYLANTLRAITGTSNVEIEAWFLSHMHDDHVTEFVLLSQHPRAKTKVNNVYMNFPSRDFMSTSEEGRFLYLYDDIESAYDHYLGEGEFAKTNGKTAFTGDVIEIDGVTIEILMTPTDEGTERNINDTSMIFKVTIEGQTILFLGDAYIHEGNRLLEQYGDELKCDIVQMSHHGQAGVSQEVYATIDPTMCLWPTPIWVFENNSGIYQTTEVRGWMADLGIKYHFVAGESLTQSLTFPVDFSALPEYEIRKSVG